ncbi:MAG: AarF/ABC1/UbiB kinase family protein [Gemmatimonadaceae bacterium]|nr:AarF/ABC1/UbiB kinase family protein [Gemmatimonadaceae bacterium]
MTAGVGGSYIGYLAQGIFLSEEGRERKLKATHTKAGRRVSKELAHLRGPAMKLGQLLSLQTDVLPEEVLAELANLQREAPAMHPSLARAQFRQSLGRDPEDVFASFDPEPFAAASLGQVHCATTRKDERVAVKIQYPGIAAAIANDFKWLRAVSFPPPIARFMTRGALDELEEQITAETDYVREAANIAFMRDGLAKLPFADIPRVYPRMSTDRVLTMSLLDGDTLDAFMRRKPSQKLRDTVGAHLLELFYYQLFAMEAFHADPHWGNYLFRDDGTLGLVDFGCVKYVPRKFVANLRKIFLYPGSRQSPEFRALLDERYSLFGQSLEKKTKAALINFAENFYGRVYPPDPADDERPFDFSEVKFFQDYLRESGNLIAARGALPEYLFLARAESGLYQTLHRLRARVHTSKIVRRYLNK